jgi:Protein ENHANCED DISEASE RESISTANCE 2, C-terminal
LLQTYYCSYLETDVEIGSSSVAASVTRLSIGYAKTLVVELAWAIQGENEEELPEVILGTFTTTI